MLPPALLYHGGDLAAARAQWPDWQGAWLDLSTGINPWPWRAPRLQHATLTRLPTPADRGALMRAARTAYRLPPEAGLAAVPGSEAAIHLIPRLLPPARVCLIGPTYSGHQAGWGAAGHQVIESDAPEDADVLVLCRPNNPTGATYPEISEAALCGRYKLIVIDEAYADTADPALLEMLPGVIGLRSFGKFFGLAGVRLGFVWGDPAITGELERALGAWSLGGPALAWGRAALADEPWQQQTRLRLARESALLAESLTAAGLTVIGQTDFFCLVETPGLAHAIAAGLGTHGILVRAFTDHPHWLRVGLPPSSAARLRLVKALKAAQATR
ncbi:MAG: aminotransferase class I/II-fold pyridoxal phosphate-dependent enzyme [Elstera sp.]